MCAKTNVPQPRDRESTVLLQMEDAGRALNSGPQQTTPIKCLEVPMVSNSKSIKEWETSQSKSYFIPCK